MALILGVTGSIATGKSYLCSYLCSAHGAVHADADKVVHRMYDPGTTGFDKIVSEFGDVVIGSDGYIDRKVLGSQVFGDKERMSALTKAIGDIAGEMKSIIDKWRQELPSDGIGVLEAVNLIEAGYSKWCDATWLVAVDNSVALPRLMARNSFATEEAQQRIDAQQPWQKRSPASDFIFHNNSDVQTFTKSIDDQLPIIKELYLAGTLPEPRWFSWDKERQAANSSDN